MVDINRSEGYHIRVLAPEALVILVEFTFFMPSGNFLDFDRIAKAFDPNQVDHVNDFLPYESKTPVVTEDVESP